MSGIRVTGDRKLSDHVWIETEGKHTERDSRNGSISGKVKICLKRISQESKRMTTAKTPSNNWYEWSLNSPPGDQAILQEEGVAT